MFEQKKAAVLAPLRTVLVFLGLTTCIFAVGMALAPELIATFLPVAFGMMGATFLGIGWMAAR